MNVVTTSTTTKKTQRMNHKCLIEKSFFTILNINSDEALNNFKASSDQVLYDEMFLSINDVVITRIRLELIEINDDFKG